MKKSRKQSKKVPWYAPENSTCGKCNLTNSSRGGSGEAHDNAIVGRGGGARRNGKQAGGLGVRRREGSREARGPAERGLTYQRQWQVNSHLLCMHNERYMVPWHRRRGDNERRRYCGIRRGTLFNIASLSRATEGWCFSAPASSCKSLCIRWDGVEVRCIIWAEGLCRMRFFTPLPQHTPLLPLP